MTYYKSRRHLFSDYLGFYGSLLLGFILAFLVGLFIYKFFSTFERVPLVVYYKSWETTTQLVHTEEDDDGKDITVVDAEVSISGSGLDQVEFLDPFDPRWYQDVEYIFSSDVRLDSNGRIIHYSPDLDTYLSIPLGGYCYAEVNVFDYVRYLECGGR